MVWHAAGTGRPPAAPHPLSVLEPSPPPGTTLADGQPLQLRDAAQEPATRPHATHAGDGYRPDRPYVELSGVYLAAGAYRSGPEATDGSPYHPSADPGTASTSQRQNPDEVFAGRGARGQARGHSEGCLRCSLLFSRTTLKCCNFNLLGQIPRSLLRLFPR